MIERGTIMCDILLSSALQGQSQSVPKNICCRFKRFSMTSKVRYRTRNINLRTVKINQRDMPQHFFDKQTN